MKIEQDLETGKIYYKLAANEKYNLEEHLEAMNEFLNKQAVEIFRLRNSYRRLVGELNEIKANLNKNGTSAIDR